MNPDTGGALPRTTSMMVGAPSTDPNGVKSYAVTSVFQGPSPTIVRVLEPHDPVPGQPRRFLYVLPVEAGVSSLDSTWSDGLEELRLLDVPNRFNLTLIAPSFDEPWYGDHATDPDRRLESFIVRDLVPFGRLLRTAGNNSSTMGHRFQQVRIRRPHAHPAKPECLQRRGRVGCSCANHRCVQPRLWVPGGRELGTQETCDQYVIPNLVINDAEPFLVKNRIWISGDRSAWTADMDQLHDQMQQAGIVHTWVAGGFRVHSWNSGWLDGAVTSLDRECLDCFTCR